MRRDNLIYALFSTVNMLDITVIMSILNMNGACVVFRSGLHVDGVLGVLAFSRSFLRYCQRAPAVGPQRIPRRAADCPAVHVSGQAVAKVLRHLNSVVRSQTQHRTWSLESPAPIEVTTATLFTSYFFIAAITVAVPASSVASMASRGHKDAVWCRPSASSGPHPSSCRPMKL